MIPKIKANVSNLNSVIAQIKRIEKRQINALERGLKMAGLFIQAESQKIVPVDTAALKNSARTKSERMGSKVEVQIYYQTEYAIFVHEDLTAKHKAGKTAKFLEIPMRKNRRKINQIVANEIKKG